MAETFRELMPGGGVDAAGAIREGKISFRAAHKGVFWIDEARLREFNMVPEVICATRHCGSVVEQGSPLASSRAIPLYLSREKFLLARNALAEGPLFSVLPMRRKRIGVLITGTEVFQGLIEDRFEPVITQKAQALGCEIVRVNKAPDDAKLIREGVEELLLHELPGEVEERLMRIREQLKLYEDDNAEELLRALSDILEKEEEENGGIR